MRSQKMIRSGWVAAVLALSCAACAPDEGTGSAALAVRFEGRGPAGATRGVLSDVVQSIRVEVRAGTTSLKQALFDYEGLQGVVEGIPAGADRTFAVEALQGNTVVYAGESVGVTIRAGEQAQVLVTLSPAYDPADDAYAPGPVTDLAAEVVGGDVRLTWTAVGDDGLVGQAATTDLRWSLSTIQSTNFATANPVAGVPAPATAGTVESFTVTGLAPGSTYHFAVRVLDDLDNASRVSNEAIVQLTNGDVTAPAAITDLAVGAVDRSSVTLTWTAPGDDGATGQVAQYNVRYSTSPIDEANFLSALPAPGPASPVAGGQLETLRITGLTLGQTYHFAIRAADEVPNWSALSNVPTGTPLDTIPPAAVVLSELEVSDTAVRIGWTAPGDDGNVGTATAYELRMSTDPIDADNFGSATGVTGLPAPSSAGTAEEFVVTPLAMLTPYYFALRTLDAAGNPSPLSNVLRSVPGQQDTTAPAAVSDLTVVDVGEGTLTLEWTAPGDDGALGSVTSYDLRYAGAAIDSEGAFDAAVPVTWPAGTPLVSGGQVQAVVLDGLTIGTTYHFALKAADNVGNLSPLSNSDSGAPVDLTGPAAVSDLQAEAFDDTTIFLSWSAPADNGPAGRAASYEIRYSQNPIDAVNFPLATPAENIPAPAAPGSSESLLVPGLTHLVPYHFAMISHDAAGNPSALSNPTSAAPGLQDTTAPGAFTLAVVGTTEGDVTLEWTAPGDDGAAGTVSAYDLRTSGSAITTNLLFDAADPIPWPVGTTIVAAGQLQQVVLSGLTAGTTYHFAAKAADNVGNLSPLSNDVAATPQDTTPPEAVTGLVVIGTTDTSITVQWPAPHEDGAAGGAVDHYEIRSSLNPITAGNFASGDLFGAPPTPGAPGNLDSVEVTGLFLGVPNYIALISYDAGGNPSGLSNVVSDVPGSDDVTPPGTVSNLAAAAVDESSVRLTFTAPGDDGASGTVSAYDVRYSEFAIQDEADFAGAAQFTWPGGTPIVAGGSGQAVIVSPLALGVTYHFALKARDHNGNWSGLSNEAVGGPADLVPPGVIGDLIDTFIGVGQVDLAWTAPAEDGASGLACAEYDLRYSATPITTDDEFDLALRWTTGMPAPSAPGTLEGVSVTLPAGDYHFSIKARDAAGLWSGLPASLFVSIP